MNPIAPARSFLGVVSAMLTAVSREVGQPLEIRVATAQALSAIFGDALEVAVGERNLVRWRRHGWRIVSLLEPFDVDGPLVRTWMGKRVS